MNTLARFKHAQEREYANALQQLMNAKKTSHWMWFIFPQIVGLGKSSTSNFYAIQDLDEACLYLSDELLASRIVHLTEILLNQTMQKSLVEIFGFTDSRKFHSSMTLFYTAVQSHSTLKENPALSCFERALDKYFNGKPDEQTTVILQRQKQSSGHA